MNETNPATTLLGGMRPELARRRILSFSKHFGPRHLYLARHAAFPLALTPDLLYRLWANFPRNIQGELLKIPWVAVADLLLSSLCEEVGQELYEMNVTVRNELLSDLKTDPNFGNQRIKELSGFLLAYVNQQLNSSDSTIRDFAQTQQWTALAYTKPNEAAQKLASALHLSLEQSDRAEQLRIASLIETFAAPLEGFTPLLIYARGVASLVRGDTGEAIAQFRQIAGGKNVWEFEGVKLQIPAHILRTLGTGWQTIGQRQGRRTGLSNKLFVLTDGTIAANVGQELLRQIDEHPKSELEVLVRSLDTARLNQRRTIRDGEWYQMTIDQRHMRAVYQARARNPYLSSMLYDDLLPFTTGVGASRIRYNGAGALAVNRDQIKRWLSGSISTLSRSTKGDTSVSFAAIISSVGATGSGSIQRLVELLADAASDVAIEMPINCDIFIMLPESEGVDELGLANTFALFAELAATRLARKHTDSEYVRGRIILVGWGKTRSLKSIPQLEEATATLVRLIHDPITDFAAAYENSLVDHHILRQLDDVTVLPTHLSTVTAVTISLGNLVEQIVERDTNSLVTHLVFGNQGTNHTNLDLFLDTLSPYMPGETAQDQLVHLLDSLSRNLRLQTSRPAFESEATGRGISDPKEWLQQRWIADKSAIDQNLETIRGAGITLVRELVKQWKDLQIKGITTSSANSLSSLNGSYQRLIKELEQILRIAREPLVTHASNDDVVHSLNALTVQARGGVVPKKENDRERPSLIRAALDKIKRNIEDYLEQKTNPIALEVLEELLFETNRAQRDLTIVLTRLNKHRQSIEVASTQRFSLGSDHMLEIPALSSQRDSSQESEIDSYYKQISRLAPREKKRLAASGEVVTESDPYVEFRRWLGNDPEREEQLFQGDIERLQQMVRGYIQKIVVEEVEKYSVLDILLRDNGITLRKRLQEAASVAYPLVNLNTKYTLDERTEMIYLSTYWGDNDQKRGELQKAVDQTFGRGRCVLLPTKDPTEIVIFSYIDGLSMAAVQDLTSRCFDAFLKQRKRWLDQKRDNPTQNIGIPIYSGKDAEERVLQHNIICKLNIAVQKDLSPFSNLPEVRNCV